MSVSISNGTTLTVTLVVNDAPVATVAPGVDAAIPASRLSSLPWRVEARSPSGRVLVSMIVRLPRTLDDIRGLRVARWIRESTAGQYDRYGPASQREQQDRFIERHGLVDTGLVFQVAQSGTTVWRSPTMNEMLGQAKAGA
ncbi:MAG TPA: hypothetical protein VIK38_03190, partial [Coriobacteriia bacterium]